MPKLHLPIADPYIQIERPVAMAMAKSIVELASIKDDVIISFPGHAQSQPLFNSRGGKDGSSDTIANEHSSKLSVSVVEDFEEYGYLTTPVHQTDSLNVFSDTSLDLLIRPIYVTTTATMSLTYRCADKKEAQAFYDKFRVMYSENRAEFTLRAAYKYSLPREFFTILTEIHRLREARGGYGEDFPTWFNAHNSDKSTIIANSSGSKLLQAYSERQDNIVAYFDFTEPPKPEKGDQGSTWMIDFDFKYTYEKPTRMYMKYPLVVHNQILGEKFRGPGTDKTLAKMEGSQSLSSADMQYFRDKDVFPQGAYHGVRIPFYDEWENTTQPVNTHNIVTALLGFTESGIAPAVKLDALPYYTLDEKLWQYMRENPEKVTDYCSSPFHVAVYENGDRIPSELVNLDAELNLTLGFEVNVRNTYRVQITLLGNLTIVPTNRLDEFRKYPELCTMLFQALLPSQKIDVRYIANKLFPRKEFWDLARAAQLTPKHYKSSITQLERLVGIFIIKTRR